MLDKASIRARLDRSQELYIKTSRYVEELAKSQNLSMRSLLSEVYEDSVYKTAYEAQKLKGKFSTFKEVAKQDIETAVSKPWASDGKDFSQRIWENKTQLMNTLQTEMTRSFMIGEGVAPLINRIQKRFNVSFSNARRLVETETAYVQEKAMLDTYDALDVEQYQILAVLDLKTSGICRHLDKKYSTEKTPSQELPCRRFIATAVRLRSHTLKELLIVRRSRGRHVTYQQGRRYLLKVICIMRNGIINT